MVFEALETIIGENLGHIHKWGLYGASNNSAITPKQQTCPINTILGALHVVICTEPKSYPRLTNSNTQFLKQIS